MRRKKLLALGLAVAAVAALGTSGATAQRTSDPCSDPEGCVVVRAGEPVRIGTFVVAEQTPGLGTDSARAVELAADLRGGSVAGHPVRLVHLADGCDAGLATTTAEAIAGDRSLVAVIGTTCSGAALEVAPILGGAGIPMISPSNTVPQLTDPAMRDPFYFRTAPNDGYALEALAEFLRGEGLSTAATLAVDDSLISVYADRFADRFAELGGIVTDQLTVADDQGDFSTELATIASAPPDVLLFVLFNTPPFVTQARDTAGLEGTLLASTDGFVNQFLLDNLDDPADAEGIVFSAYDLSFLEEEPYLSRLLAEYEPRFGAPESGFPGHAWAFDATNRLLDVIQTFQRRGSRQLVIPRTALRDAFAATSDYPGVTGSITCDPNGDCNPQEFVIRVVEDGEFVQLSP